MVHVVQTMVNSYTVLVVDKQTVHLERQRAVLVEVLVTCSGRVQGQTVVQMLAVGLKVDEMESATTQTSVFQTDVL